MPSLQGGFRRLDRLASRPHLARALVFAATLAVFLGSDVLWIADSRYSILLSQSLLDRGSPRLDPYFVGPLDPGDFPGALEGELPFQITPVAGHLYYYFPPGSSVLSIPFVAALDALGLSAVDHQGRYDKRAERKIQRLLAAFLMAVFAVLVYELARAKLPPRWSLVVAAVTAFGTPVWSTATRALWSQTWTLLLVGAVAYLLVAHAAGRRPLRGWLLGTLLAWAYFTRPTASIPLLGVGVFLLLRERRALPGYAMAVLGWGAGFVAYAWHCFGALLPPYYAASRLEPNPALFGLALTGHLVSPSRGLLVFVPQLLVVGWLLVRYRARVSHRALLAVSLSVFGLHVVAVSSFPGWWAGYSYGPRLFTEALPWLVVLGVLAIDAWRRAEPRAPAVGARVRGALAAALVALSIGIHAPAAISRRTKDWCRLPVDVNRHHSRLWDWSDPQFLAWARPRPAAPSAAGGPDAGSAPED